MVSGNHFQKIEDVSKSLIVNTDTLYSTEPSASLRIDFLDNNSNILHRYPSNMISSMQVDFYDYYYSKKTIELLEGTTNANRPVIRDTVNWLESYLLNPRRPLNYYKVD